MKSHYNNYVRQANTLFLVFFSVMSTHQSWKHQSYSLSMQQGIYCQTDHGWLQNLVSVMDPCASFMTHRSCLHSKDTRNLARSASPWGQWNWMLIFVYHSPLIWLFSTPLIWKEKGDRECYSIIVYLCPPSFTSGRRKWRRRRYKRRNISGLSWPCTWANIY